MFTLPLFTLPYQNVAYIKLHGSTPLSIILLPILSVSLMHTALTSRPSYLAGKGAERQIEKPRPMLLLYLPY